MTNRKLSAVPDHPDPKITRQQIEQARIEQRHRELINQGFNAYVYSDPIKRSPVLQMNESSRKGTLQIVLASSKVSWWRRLIFWK